VLLNVVHYNNTGRSPVRPIAVVVYLIRPNRGLTAVLLGKSTTTARRTRQSLVPSFYYRYLVFLIEQPDQTAAASLVHRTCTVFLGHTQTRVDLRFAPLLL
jgi:hypothetical protein